VAFCHVWLNVCAGVLERSAASRLGSENTGIDCQLDGNCRRKQLPLLSSLRIFQAAPLNPPTGTSPKQLAGNCWIRNDKYSITLAGDGPAHKNSEK
jgi:hypothetical protein